ncbi:MAG: pre-peptidase C-terminal domain-containing protein [Thermoplasmata archaeon]|nr:pre-peptidase C-terminal domain-containing protein [Thermoplasmata archaeon]
MKIFKTLGARTFAMAIMTLLLAVCLSTLINNASANLTYDTIVQDESHIYYIDVTSYTTIDISVDWGYSTNDIDIYLYDASVIEVASSTQTDTISETISHYPISTGTYAIYVLGYDITGTESYSITCNFYATRDTGGGTTTASADIYESDNDWLSSTTLSDGITQTHSIHNGGLDVDWYSFTLYDNNDVTITTSGLSGDTEIALYDSTGVPSTYLTSDDDGGSGSFSSLTRYDLPAGTYYIELIEHGMDAEIPSYDIDLSLSSSLGLDLGLFSFDDYLCLFIFLIIFIVLIAGISSSRKKRKKKKLERKRQQQYQAQQAQHRGRQQSQQPRQRAPQQQYQTQQQPQYQQPAQQTQYQQPYVPPPAQYQDSGKVQDEREQQKRGDDRRAKAEMEKLEAEKQTLIQEERKEQILRENRERQEATRKAREEREGQERMDAEKRADDKRYYQEERERRARQVEEKSQRTETETQNVMGMLHSQEGSDMPPPPPAPAQAPAPHTPPPPPDPELLKILNDACDLIIPTYLDPDATAEIIIDIKNNSNMDLESIEVNFSDMQKYFEIQDTLVFPGVRRGMTLREDVKFKPKYNEGSFPVIIEIVSGGARLKEEYTIKVGGTEIY